MSNVLKLARAWIPAVSWMLLIFYLSSRHKVQVSPDDAINFIFFKSLHVIEYAILYSLLFRAMYLSQGKKITTRVYALAALIAILYAASDEFHQTFIATRTGKIRDIFIDAIGIGLMYSYIKTHVFIVKKYFS